MNPLVALSSNEFFGTALVLIVLASLYLYFFKRPLVDQQVAHGKVILDHAETAAEHAKDIAYQYLKSAERKSLVEVEAIRSKAAAEVAHIEAKTKALLVGLGDTLSKPATTVTSNVPVNVNGVDTPPPAVTS